MSDAAVRAAHREALAARAVWLTALESGAGRERTAELFDIYLELLRVAARRAAIAEPGPTRPE